MTTFFEHQKSAYKKDYLRNLIALAMSDGHLAEDELKMVYRIGQSRGLKDWQVKSLLEEDYTNYDVFLPETSTNRMNLLYDFMQIIYADGLVNHPEIDFVKAIVARFNLRPELTDHLIDLFQYGAPTPTEWKEFVDYMNHVFAQ